MDFSGYPTEPKPPQDDGKGDGFLYAIPVMMLFSCPAMFIYNLAHGASVPEAAPSAFINSLILALTVSAIVFAQDRLRRNARQRAYEAERLVFEEKRAAWNQKIDAQRARQQELARQMEAEQQRQRALELERQARQAAQAAYERAVAEQNQKTAYYLAAFNAAYAHVKYEAGLYGVTQDADIRKIFVEQFQHLEQFRHPDAGLLRRHQVDPRVAAVLGLLPSLPSAPRRVP